MSDRQSQGDAPFAERLVALLGAALVVVTIAFLLYQAFAVENDPPEITLEPKAPIPVARGYLVPIDVHNLGGRTVAALGISAALEQGGEVLERDEATVDYVPARSTRRAGFFFEHDPATLELKLDVGGFQTP